MRRIDFTEDEIKQLSHERIYHPHAIVRRRMAALYLKSVGYRHKDICKELNIKGITLCSYLDLFINEGIEGLKRLRYKGKRNLLLENADEIIAHLESNPPGTLKEAQARIEEISGIKRSLPQISAFFKKTHCAPKSETDPGKGRY